jgi:hypothetical protein
MKGFEVLGYPVWNDVKHNSSREDGYIRWSFCSFKDGVIDCNGSEEYMVFQTNTQELKKDQAVYIDRSDPDDVYIDLFPMPDVFDVRDQHVKYLGLWIYEYDEEEDQGVHNGYCQKVYERKVGEAVIELLHHEYLANKE